MSGLRIGVGRVPRIRLSYSSSLASVTSSFLTTTTTTTSATATSFPSRALASYFTSARTGSSSSLFASSSARHPRKLNMPSMPKGLYQANSSQAGTHAMQIKDKDLFRTESYVNGEWVKSSDNTTFKVANPATNAALGEVADLTRADVRKAIDAAAAAFPSWSKTTGKQRHDYLRKLFDAIQANADDLAHILCAENGKPLPDAKGEITYGNSFLEWFAAEAVRSYGHIVPSAVPGVRNTVIKQPIGVAGLITPWNFPNAMITRKMAPALAAGCTVVIKAPAETPFSALALCELAHRVGIPKGVINVVTVAKGGEKEKEAGKEICENPNVRKVSFTGSTNVGKLLMTQSASTMKKLSFELGGNAPFIVFGDADLELAVASALTCKFRGSGQTCVCANRLYVHESVYAEFASKLAEKVDAFKVGNGMDEGVTHGPLINVAGVDKVDRHVQDAVKKGAQVLVGGRRGEGNFYEPTVLSDVPADCQIADEETFGPVAALFKFSTEEEVVKLANNTNVGLAGYFFSQDVSRCFRVAEALHVGMVGVNTGILSEAAIPFGGVLESGFGREGGKTGIEEYQVDKLIRFGGI